MHETRSMRVKYGSNESGNEDLGVGYNDKIRDAKGNKYGRADDSHQHRQKTSPRNDISSSPYSCLLGSSPDPIV